MNKVVLAVSLAFAPVAFAAEYTLPVNADTVHWGYFSKNLTPNLYIESGDTVTVETLTHHANDDASLMVDGDPGAESVFFWDENSKGVDRRGAGPVDHPRGTGGGFGVHILTGPIYVAGAEKGDVIEIQILDVVPRPSASNKHVTYGSNAAAAWGFHYSTLTDPREVITIYKIEKGFAEAAFNYRWTPQTDPYGVVHEQIDYPGVPVDPETVTKDYSVLDGVRIPLRPHFGTIGVAPDYDDNDTLVDSVPPSIFGGNIDNWRIGKGNILYLPVQVSGALLSVGDPHSSQGDSEFCGTAIETSLTGKFKIVLHKNVPLEFPLLETPDSFVVMGFSFKDYLNELADPQSTIYSESSIDKSMKNAYLNTRDFMMSQYGLTEDEAISLATVAVDFGITQVVDGNWGSHSVIRKCLFDGSCKTKD
jgi:acetamidase/formamidase